MLRILIAVFVAFGVVLSTGMPGLDGKAAAAGACNPNVDVCT